MEEKKGTLYKDVKITDLGNSEVEIQASIPAENLEPFKTKTLNKLRKDANVPGFRPGKVPDNILMEKLGEQGLLQEAAELALQEVYPLIVIENEIHTIGRPQISITKIAEGNPLEFRAKTAVVPEVTLPDYKKIAKVEMAVMEDIIISDEEVDEVLKDIRKTRTRTEKKLTPDAEVKDEDLLPLTDEFVQKLGDFKTVDSFKKQIRENMGKEKEIRNKEKKRVAISEEMIKKSKTDLPQLLIDSELEKMKAQFQDDVSRMGIEFDEYLKKISKTEEDLKKDWKDTAEKRAKLQLILNKISVAENLVPASEEVQKQVDHLKEHYKDADEGRITIYVETMMTNDLVFEFLESFGPSKGAKASLEEGAKSSASKKIAKDES